VDEVLRACRAVEAGTAVSVRVVPRAKRSGVVGVHGEALKVRVAAPPVEGKANAALVGHLAEVLGVRASDVAVTAGARGRDKTVHVAGLAPDEVAAALAAARR